jgi:hypothetical protein
MDERDAELTIVTVETATGRRGVGDPVRRIVESRVSVGQVQANLARFLDAVRAMLAEQSTQAGAFELDEIALGVEISASGEFKVLGSGVAVEGTSGITLTWRRANGPGRAAGASASHSESDA